TVDHYGYIVAGKFHRGHKRGGGRYVNSMQRDRVRALQLMNQALLNTKNEKSKYDLASFHLAFADMVLHGAGVHAAWRLQYLTDLTKLPDYEDGNPYGGFRGRGGRGGGWSNDAIAAPVDEQGNPVFHKVPKSFAAAASDGERWRWLLERAAQLDPNR